MSYEGYEQHICKNGHQFDTDCHDEDSVCFVCLAPSAWYNAVDDTNGESAGIILDFSSLLLTPEESAVCNLGHTHILKHATYRIPFGEEYDALRSWEVEF